MRDLNLFLTPHETSGGGAALPAAKATDVVLEGAGQHPGYVVSKACVIRFETQPVPERHVPDEQLGPEVTRLLEAAALIEAEFHTMVEKSPNLALSQGAMSESLRLVRPTNSVMMGAKELIEKERYSAEYAVQLSFDRLFASVDEEFVRDRAYEILDVKNRLLKVLHPEGSDIVAQLKSQLEAMSGPKIVIIENLSPAQALQLYGHNIKGLVIKNTSHTGHQDLVLSDLDCPVIGNLDLVTNSPIENGEEIIVDGDHGLVTIRPSGDLRQQAIARMVLLDAPEGQVPLSAHAPMTRDGIRIKISGDLKNPEKLHEFSSRRVCDIGLVRTEFGIMRANRWPTEEELVAEYRAILRGASPHPVSLRTFDFGFDKDSEALGTKDAVDSGLRGLRYALSLRPKEFKSQLRAMLIAANEVGNEMRIIFPMVLDAGDMRRARAVYDSAVSELVAERRIPRAPQYVKLGAMIETSSAVELIDPILRRCDFISMGTNDLLISTLDGDLNKASGAHYHPAFLSCARKVAQAARIAGKDLFICGEMPCHTKNVPLLVGIGATNFVVSWNSIEAVNAKISRCDSTECSELVQRIIDCGDGDEAYEIHVAFLEKLQRRGEGSAT